MAEISFKVALVTVIKEFNVLFFVGIADKGQAIVDLIFGDRKIVVKVRENRSNHFGFRAGRNDPGKNKLSYQIVYSELKVHLIRQNVNDFLEIVFF